MHQSPMPRMVRARQLFPESKPLDVPRELARQLQPILASLKKGAQVGVAVGSRGITNLVPAVRSIVEAIRQAGGQPFILPAMGSHGGATPAGQQEVLAHYDVTESTCGAPVRPSMEVEAIGTTPDGITAYCSVEAMRADAVIILNRIKPHTDFAGAMGSGIMKMSVIGLGKHKGAAQAHVAATRLGHEHVLRTLSRVILAKAPVVCGVALIENQFHQTAHLEVIPRGQIEARENELFLLSKKLMPRLPFDDVDLLIVDRIGKNISGAGMDPNVTGRGVQGYYSALSQKGDPTIRRIFVRDLTPETDGNGIGIGFADFTTSRLVQALNKKAVFVNSLTSLTPHAAKIPMHFDTDEEVLRHALPTLAMENTRQARVIRIQDTLNLTDILLSESYLEEVRQRSDLAVLSEPEEVRFGPDGNLADSGS